MTAINAKAKFVKLLTRKGGADGDELRDAMNRAWRPTMYQLRPIAEKLGFCVMIVAPRDGSDLTRYRFVPRKVTMGPIAQGYH